ncbi:MAG: polysaccharide deacetylase family protein [Mycoplasmataceae bacterium]|nr:polysaccharide deacetylase family protein [Mycoplasmataceae bacterium]
MNIKFLFKIVFLLILFLLMSCLYYIESKQNYKTIGSVENPSKGALVLSFDDYYTQWYENRDLFLKYNAKVTFFVNDRRDTLNYIRDLESFINDGHEIGWHGKTHLNLNKFWDSNKIKLNSETFLASQEMSKLLSINITSFAYPYGQYNLDMVEYLKKYYIKQRSFILEDAFYTFEDASSTSMLKSQSIDNINYLNDEDFKSRISAQLQKASDNNLIIFYTTHQITKRKSWKISRKRLDFLLSETVRLNLDFLRYKDLYKLTNK